MQADLLISRVLDDEGLTNGLGDPEARLLIEWLVEQVEVIAAETDDEAAARKDVELLCKRARTMARFVTLWCHRQDHAAATQLAGAERVNWPLPLPDCNDPIEALQEILEWERRNSPVAAVRNAANRVPESET